MYVSGKYYYRIKAFPNILHQLVVLLRVVGQTSIEITYGVTTQIFEAGEHPPLPPSAKQRSRAVFITKEPAASRIRSERRSLGRPPSSPPITRHRWLGRVPRSSSPWPSSRSL